MAIIGTHAILYSSQPDEVREILRDLFELGHVDAGGGWLIMKAPPAEIAVHPSEPGDAHHEVSLVCDDLVATMADLRAKGLDFDHDPEDQGWGLVTHLLLPGDLKVLLYQPRHPIAAASVVRSFGFESTTDDVLEGIDLTGKRILVTGASAGLGVETTRSLAAHGASVTMAVRDLTKGAAAMDDITARVPHADLDLRQLDLADLSSIRTFAHGFLEDHDVLDVLIGNAGIMACPEGRTVDGFELQFGTNHLGHFLLIDLLTPALVAASGARVVLLTSAGHRFGDVDLDDPSFDKQPYDAWTSYGRAKTANVLCAVGVDQRLKDQGVRAFVVHPGGIQTELGRHLTDETLSVLIERQKAGNGPVSWKTVEQGAATTVWAATAPELDGEGGRYLEDCHIAEVIDDPNVSGGVRPYAIDPDRADVLWELSERLVSSRDD